jgi:HD superfamily phosphodiesterase
MSDSRFTLDDIIRMTVRDGEGWAAAHAKRLIELAKRIGVGIHYDSHVVELVAYLHDWGAFPKSIQPGVDHALRSRQVVEEEILPRLDLTAGQKDALLEAIELHDYRDPRSTRSNEALLLREADMLDFLGMIGMAREFSWGPKNLQACYRRILSRRDGIQNRFTLPRAKEIARVRLERMEQCLQWLEEESLGVM